MSGLGPDTYVALPLINIHSFFFKDSCSYWDIFISLPEPYDLDSGFGKLGLLNCITKISYAILLKLARFSGCADSVGGARQIGPMVFVVCLACVDLVP